MALYGPTRNVDMSKQETELAVNIKKATSPDETAPKRKHVRSCIVYTWDHKSSQSFWSGMKVQPILADEVQTFKALITIHKVLQEGHPIVLKEAQANIGWLESLRRGVVNGEGVRGYNKLIEEYISFLRAKLAFHKQHPEFNGTFEYEEYISLKTTNDPNEGYETITDLMILQDQIDSFQKLIFAHIPHSAHSECRISALVPLVQESYGIYKFITNMLRAMHTTLGDDEALAGLRERYSGQHYRLVKFYYECGQLRYLTSLITVPRLPQEPPSLISEDEDRPAPPARPKEPEKSPSPEQPARAPSVDPEPINEFWKNQDAYAEQQRRLQEQFAADRRQQEERERMAQLEYEQQQRQQAENQRLEQERLAQQQHAQQAMGRLAELERENLDARARFAQDQLLLQQYDRKLSALEQEMAQVQANYQQQTGLKDDQIKALQELVNTWRSKYDSLAKLYTQLRNEHLDLLNKFKGVQTKAASAQEAIDQREKLQRELKQKNLDLANMLRERDRAMLDRDRATGGHKEEVDRLTRELRFAREEAENNDRAKGTELSSMLHQHNREIADLQETLRQKNKEYGQLHESMDDITEVKRQLHEKDEQLEIVQAGMDETILEFNALKEKLENMGDNVEGNSGIHHSVKKFSEIVDALLKIAILRIEDGLFELDSTLHPGNQSATGVYALSQIELCGQTAMDFSAIFREFIADGAAMTHADIVKTCNAFSGAVYELLGDIKGLTRFASDEKKAEQLISGVRTVSGTTIKYFKELMSFRLNKLDDIAKQNVVINNNYDMQLHLQNLQKIANEFAPKNQVTDQAGDLEAMVDKELQKAADDIDAAVARLNEMKNKPKDEYSTYEVKIHDSILEAAFAVTNAIARLIKAATASQQEIVRQGKGNATTSAFYKKHNRWTEGLISAAKAVANSTNTLIETADGVISGRNSPEQLIVASNDVSASTAQLVAASRVKASLMSKTQDTLEAASKAVTQACRSLVTQVQEIILQRNEGDDKVEYDKLTNHELKTQEMEQQVEILKLENELSKARTRLGDMRKLSYQDE